MSCVPPGAQHNAAADYYNRNQYSLGGDYARQQQAQQAQQAAQQRQAAGGYGPGGGAYGQGGGAYGQQQVGRPSQGELVCLRLDAASSMAM